MNSFIQYKKYIFYEKNFPLIVALLEKDSLPLKGPIAYLDWYLRSEITKLIVNKKIDLDKKETFLYTTNSVSFCKNFIFYNLGTKEEILENLTRNLLNPLEDTLLRLKINSFFLIPSMNSSLKIREIMDFFKLYQLVVWEGL